MHKENTCNLIKKVLRNYSSNFNANLNAKILHFVYKQGLTTIFISETTEVINYLVTGRYAHTPISSACVYTISLVPSFSSNFLRFVHHFLLSLLYLSLELTRHVRDKRETSSLTFFRDLIILIRSVRSDQSDNAFVL